MRLEEAFKRAVQKYYEGFEYASVKGALGKEFEYDFNTLDTLHKDLTKKRKKPVVEEVEDEEEDFSMEDEEIEENL